MQTRDIKLIRESVSIIQGHSISRIARLDEEHSIMEFAIPNHKSIVLVVKITEVLDTFPLRPLKMGKRLKKGSGAICQMPSGNWRWRIYEGNKRVGGSNKTYVGALEDMERRLANHERN
jgi:hypothetical protein